VNHDAGKQILHAVIHLISDGGALEDLGQQLLLVAFTPAIHKIYCNSSRVLKPELVHAEDPFGYWPSHRHKELSRTSCWLATAQFSSLAVRKKSLRP